MTASIENYGNFFAQNLFPAASGVLLIQGALAEAGYGEVTISSVAAASIPVAIIVLCLSFVQVWLKDKKLRRREE